MKFTIKPLEGVDCGGTLISPGALKSTVAAALGEPEGVYKKSFYYFKNELRIDFDENECVRFIEFLGGADGRLRPWIFGVSVFDTDADELTALLAEHNSEAPVDNENGHCLLFRNIGVGIYRDVIAERWSTIGIGSKDYYV